MRYAYVGDGLRENESRSLGPSPIGPRCKHRGYTRALAFLRVRDLLPVRRDADELDSRFPCDREGQAIDRERAYDRIATEGDIGVDERGGLASKGSS